MSNSVERRTKFDDEAAILAKLKEWGVTNDEISTELMAYAQHVLAVKNSRIGEMVVEFGYASREDVERLAKTKPANIVMLEHLSDNLDNLRPHSQKLLASNDKIAYYHTLASAPIHAEFASNQSLKKFCHQYNCLPLMSNRPDTLRLVFADYTTQKDYSQRSRLVRANDPIGILQSFSKMPNLIFGIAQREEVLSLTNHESTEAVQATDDEDKINFWSENNANTDNQKLIGRILSIAVEKKASNIKFTPRHNGTVDIFYRRHGNLRRIEGVRPLSAQQADEINRFLHTKSIARHTDTAQRVEGRLLSPADGQFVYKTSTSETFLRCSFIPLANDGLSHVMESISIRLLPRDSISVSLKEKNVSQDVIDVARSHLLQSHGLILVVGPTSSGKSTTIAGMISQYLEIYKDSRNLVSLEQPVERHLDGISQINVHQNKFEAGMAALLRHDPDFIWVGELRDRPSASTCIRSSNTGHIVVSTLHADDAPSAFNALLSYISNSTGTSADSVIVTQYDAISALSLIIAQRLVPTLCPHCKVPIDLASEEGQRSVNEYERYCERNSIEKELVHGTFAKNPAGCDRCDHEGYSGEAPINEYISVSSSLRKELILMANKGENDLEILSKHRPYTLFDEAMRLVREGHVALLDAII